MVANFEYIESVIQTYEQAAEANKNTHGRRGNIIELEPALAEDVFVTADLHGNRRNFNALKKAAELEHYPKRHFIVQEVCHGGPTYPSNGGCMSHMLLEDVAKLKVNFPNRVHFLLSNHEFAELTDYPIVKGKKMLNVLFRLGMQEMYGAATEKVRAAMQKFIRSCPLAVRMPGGVFICHTIPEKVDSRSFDFHIFDRAFGPEDLRENSALMQLLWGRDFRPENARAFGRLVEAKVFINGHEPCEAGYRAPNDMQIILDCCGEKAAYLLIPTNKDWTHAELMSRVKMVR